MLTSGVENNSPFSRPFSEWVDHWDVASGYLVNPAAMDGSMQLGMARGLAAPAEDLPSTDILVSPGPCCIADGKRC